ncbi:MAG: radical SAM family heme chaperone HemW [Halorhodospira halophila]|uniref:radical SAM family heme chaperone HemW n=1 Tax=Halorhodospira TaxID=85108 RepID=UPI001EE9456F|nr:MULTISPECIES: radical SAM family heme chaperone HemW [Halorhodospira]MCC3751727.1 radical SAM family heme chaperone HemW [Halorhodospira halophila]MCG5537829.1 radical SAM family heme chaperone HemW [Halorhodospira sp. 9622]
MTTGAGVRLPPLAVYIHLPWCLQRCGYCDFNAHALRGELPAGAYRAALGRELRRQAPAALGRRVASVFIGGGTPSLFPPAVISELLGDLDALLGFEPGAEITLEANPGANETARLRGFRQAGVTRLSLGVQTLDDTLLARLGRIHDAAAAREAVAEARSAGFNGVNVDLMYGLPGQEVAGAEADVAAAIELGVDHLSHYQLTIEPDTPFGRRPPPGLPGEDTLLAMEVACRRRLAEAGLERYEVSAFARSGQRSVHNLGYWTFGDYLGVGAGAAGKLTDPDGRVRRTRQRHSPRAWMAAAGSERADAECIELTPSEQAFEVLLNGLRLRQGLPERLAVARSGCTRAALRAWLAPLCSRGWLTWSEGRIRASETGYEMLDTLLLELLPGPPDAHRASERPSSQGGNALK